MARHLYAEMEVPYRYLARLYGVSQRTMFDALHRRNWKHVA